MTINKHEINMVFTNNEVELKVEDYSLFYKYIKDKEWKFLCEVINLNSKSNDDRLKHNMDNSNNI